MFSLSDKETAWFTFANIMPFIMAQKSDCSDGSTSMQIYKKKKKKTYENRKRKISHISFL